MDAEKAENQLDEDKDANTCYKAAASITFSERIYYSFSINLCFFKVII